MIIWLNGAFGAGKTQTAFELQRRLKNSYVYDPENVGFFIRDNIPPSLAAPDFQDYPVWRRFNFEMLEYISQQYGGTVIVPMTITNRAYYDEIVGKLSEKHDVKHIILYAERETLLKRLASRFEGPSSWGAQQIDRCIRAFDEDITEYKIHTDSINIYQTVERVAGVCGIALPEDRRSGLRKFRDRVVTKLRHIR